LEDFYPDHILQRLHRPEAQFWDDCHLEPGDWQGLATQLLTEVFSTSFLTPLEETDTCFQLQVRHMNLIRYLEMLKSAEFRDDLDVVSTVHTPKGDIDVETPYLDARIFSARAESASFVADTLTNTRRRRWRRMPWKTLEKELSIPFEKMRVPLPIAHPVLIAALIHNRDVDGDPVNLEDGVCQQIMRAAEALQYVELTEGITAGVSAANSYDIDVDNSSPDHLTTNSDPDVVQGHILSDPDTAGLAIAAVSTSTDDPSSAQLRVVYLATPTDTSCVAYDDDIMTTQSGSRGRPAERSAGNRGASLCDLRDRVTLDIEDDEELGRHSVSNATSLGHDRQQQ